jgi:hypothetical protein
MALLERQTFCLLIELKALHRTIRSLPVAAEMQIDGMSGFGQN